MLSVRRPMPVSACRCQHMAGLHTPVHRLRRTKAASQFAQSLLSHAFGAAMSGAGRDLRHAHLFRTCTRPRPAAVPWHGAVHDMHVRDISTSITHRRSRHADLRDKRHESSHDVGPHRHAMDAYVAAETRRKILRHPASPCPRRLQGRGTRRRAMRARQVPAFRTRSELAARQPTAELPPKARLRRA